MYSIRSSPLFDCPVASLVPFHILSQPDNSPSSFSSCSVGQQRLLSAVAAQCVSFVLKARAWCDSSPSACDIDSLALDVFTSSPCAVAHDHPLDAPSCFYNSNMNRLPNDSPFSTLNEFVPNYPVYLPRSSTFSSSPTCVVPLIAGRVALPDSLHIVPLESVLPSTVAASYSASEAARSTLLRSSLEVYELSVASPLHPPGIAGSRVEYVRLIGRLLSQGMISFTSTPLAVNGVFTVGKDSVSDRLIIDARAANRLFVDCPPVALPDPSHLVQLQVPTGSTLYVGKSDLSNFYHHIGLPPWMQPYFALPALTHTELRSIGVPVSSSVYPVCVTLPMGFSHAVYLAQTVHEHIVYSDGLLSRGHNVLHMPSPVISMDAVHHGIVIDDFFLFSLNQQLASVTLAHILAAYRRAGFVVKDSKVVMPTSSPVKVIGFDIDGVTSAMSLSLESRMSLLRSTMAVLQRQCVTGTVLSQLIGRWTWCLLIRRPALSVLQHVYRFLQVAQRRRFRLWPSVRRELLALMNLLPLLQCRLNSAVFERVVATDASPMGAGVVCTRLGSDDADSYWPMCSTRRTAVLQACLHCETQANPLLSSGLTLTATERQQLLETSHWYEEFYTRVLSRRWSTIISKPWRDMEHINALELRAVSLAVHWILSYPSSLHHRVYLFVDSTVAFFSLWKGRSSSGPLLLILRQIAALLLASDLLLCVGWLPSEINPADKPSRLCST